MAPKQNSNEWKLRERIVELSDASTWRDAKREWELIYSEEVREPETCLCSHFPINELCHLQNTVNGNKTTVGNVCVTKFLGLASKSMFDCLKRVKNDEGKALNPELIELCFDRGVFNERDRSFYLDTWQKRKPSQAQLKWRVDLNRRALRLLTQKPRRSAS